MLIAPHHPLRLPEGTLSLTYDDGPQHNTLELAQFLHEHGIRATFFLIGEKIRERPQVLPDLLELGHFIGNHTNTHPRLRNLAETPSKLISEVMEVHHLIKEFVGDGPLLFRAPYGNWSQTVADLLNQNSELKKYAGHIHWDIDGADFDIGKPIHQSPKSEPYTLGKCTARYLLLIRQLMRGVVLLHDASALELTRIIVPKLKDFKFVALNEIISRI